MTSPRPWPNNARAARDEAAESLAHIISLVRPLINSSDRVVIVRAGRILDHAQNALRHLEAVGAQTAPLPADRVRAEAVADE